MKTIASMSSLLALLLTAAAASAAPEQKGPPPAPVQVETAVSTNLAPTASASGTVFSRNDAQLSAETAGRLTWVAEIGSRVGKDDVVARIDDTATRLQRDAAKAQVQRAEAQLKYLDRELVRLQSLAKENNAAISALEQTESQRDVARADLAAASASLAELQDRLDKARIRAPFDGIVTSREKNVGERLQVGEVVTRIVDPDSLEVITRAPLTSGTHVQTGDSIQLIAGDRLSTGKVRTVVPFGDARNHLIELRIEVPAGEWTVGESLRVAVPIASSESVIAVPRDALVLRREGVHVFRVDDNGKAEQVSVKPGAGSGELVAVTGNLEAGDKVIVRGAERLRSGQQVRILDEEATAKSRSSNSN